MTSTMEISVAENYHKLLGHLTVAGDEVVVTLGQKLSSSRILNVDDVQKINESSSVKDKVRLPGGFVWVSLWQVHRTVMSAMYD